MNNYFKTNAGEILIETYPLDQEGIWQIYGEDPNCDLGGHHYEPLLATVTGKLEDTKKAKQSAQEAFAALRKGKV